MSRACWRISAAALGSGRPISKRRHSASCSDDSGHYAFCTHPALRNARLREDVPGREERRGGFSSRSYSGARFFLRPAAAAGSQSTRLARRAGAIRAQARQSRPLELDRAFHVLVAAPGWPVRDTTALSTACQSNIQEPMRFPERAGQRPRYFGGPWTFSPSPVRGQGTPPSGPPPWRGSACSGLC